MAIYCGLKATNSSLDIHAIILALGFTLALLVMILSYYFNLNYLKRNHSQLILAEANTPTNKNLITFKSLIIVGIFLYLPLMVYIGVRSQLQDNFPVGNILVCVFLNGGLAYFGKSKKVRSHAKRLLKLDENIAARAFLFGQAKVCPANG